jgi:hypothetical protein
MKRLAVAVLFAIMTAVSAVSAQSTAQIGRSTIAYPAQAELDRFPIIWTKNPAQAEVRRTLGALGLRLEVLKVEWTGYNWYRHLNRFVYETIPVGTLVYVDSAGIPRYREDCGNRLVEPAKCPQCGTVGLTDSTSNGLIGALAVSTDSASVQSKSAGFWAQLTNGLKSLAVGFWNWIGKVFEPLLWLALFLLGLALLIGCVMWVLGWLLDLFSGSRNHRPAVTTVGPTPVHPVPVVHPPTPPTPVTPAPAVEGRRFVAFYPGEPGEDAMLRFRGVNRVRYEHLDGETTIRFRHI